MNYCYLITDTVFLLFFPWAWHANKLLNKFTSYITLQGQSAHVAKMTANSISVISIGKNCSDKKNDRTNHLVSTLGDLFKCHFCELNILFAWKNSSISCRIFLFLYIFLFEVCHPQTMFTVVIFLIDYYFCLFVVCLTSIISI